MYVYILITVKPTNGSLDLPLFNILTSVSHTPSPYTHLDTLKILHTVSNIVYNTTGTLHSCIHPI